LEETKRKSQLTGSFTSLAWTVITTKDDTNPVLLDTLAVTGKLLHTNEWQFELGRCVQRSFVGAAGSLMLVERSDVDKENSSFFSQV
jgi:hypothetical protein